MTFEVQSTSPPQGPGLPGATAPTSKQRATAAPAAARLSASPHRLSRRAHCTPWPAGIQRRPPLRPRIEGEVRMGVWTACSVVPVAGAVLLLAGPGGIALLNKIGTGLAQAGLPGPGLGALDAVMALRGLVLTQRQLSAEQRRQAALADGIQRFVKAREHPHLQQDDTPYAADYLAGQQARRQLWQLRHAAIRQWVVAARDSLIQGADALISLLRSMPLLGVSNVIPAAAGTLLGPVFSIATGVLHAVHAGIDWLRSRSDQRAAHAALARGLKAVETAQTPPELITLYSHINQHFVTNQQDAIRGSARDRTRAIVRAAYAAASSPLGIATLSVSIAGAAASAGIALAVAAGLCGLVWLCYLTYTAYRDNVAGAAAHALDQDWQQQCMAWAADCDAVLEQHLLADAASALRANPRLAVLMLARHLRLDRPQGDGTVTAPALARRRAARRYLLATGMSRQTLRAQCRHPAPKRVPKAVAAALYAHLLGTAARHPAAPAQPDHSSSQAFQPMPPQFRYNNTETAPASALAASMDLPAVVAPMPLQSDRKV